MGRQLREDEWLSIFFWYEQYLNHDISKIFLSYKYCEISKGRQLNKYSLKLIKTKYKLYNLGMNIKSQTGKALKKGKGSGRPRKRDIEQENKLREKTLKEMSREQLEYLITDIFYEEILKRNNSKNLEEVVEKIKKKHNFSISIKQIITILGIKKSTFYYRIKKFKLPAKNKAIQYEKQIKEAFIECKGRFGRERLSLFLKKKYQIDINPRTLGRIMNKLGLLCEIRRSKRKREIKNVNATFKNLANRDYDGQMNDIYATDVTYIPSPTDVIENHVYLSVLLHHKTKKIVSWNLSKYNDTNLVLKHFKQTKFPKKFIVHSDHGYQYSSKEFLDYIDSINGTISMSRVGNSLDNREVEYFFSILKTEIFSNFFQKAKSLTFNELQIEIDKFINWYNNERFIKKFDLKTPQQMWDVYMNNKSIWV